MPGTGTKQPPRRIDHALGDKERHLDHDRILRSHTFPPSLTPQRSRQRQIKILELTGGVVLHDYVQHLHELEEHPVVGVVPEQVSWCEELATDVHQLGARGPLQVPPMRRYVLEDGQKSGIQRFQASLQSSLRVHEDRMDRLSACQ